MTVPSVATERRDAAAGPWWNAAQLILLAAALLAGVFLAARVAAALPPALGDGRVLAGAVLFWLLVAPILIARESFRPVVLRQAGLQVAIAAVGFLGFALLTGRMLSPLALAAVLAPALCEEQVFRRALPDRFERLGVGTIPAVIVAQVLFAASHFVTRGEVSAATMVREGGRLFLFGLGYSLIVRRLGVGAGAAVHAGYNLLLRTSSLAL